MDCLSSLEKFFHNSELPPLIQIALCHYQFEAIHPFLDGNGRVGRLLVILMLIAAKMLPSPLLYLSAFFEATRDEYYRLLYVVSSEGAWEEWLLYFLNGVTVQSEDVLSRAERINQLLANWQLKVAGGRSDLPARIVHHFAVNPFLTVKKIAEEFEIAFTTAQRAIQKLVQASFVQQVATGKREKVFCATDILDILDEPAKIYSN